MKKRFLFTVLLLALLSDIAHAQDTFSIVAVDTLMGEVGCAGASCISATNPSLRLFVSYDSLGDKQMDTHIAQVKNTKTATAKPTTGTPPLSQGRDGGGACDDCPEMVFVAGGRYTMGCKNSRRDGECYDWEKPPHEVTVQDFYIGKYEVTQAEWRRVMGNDPSWNSGCDQCPVERVSWDDAQEFIRKLNARMGKKYRLPTEAEWEYAARGGNKSRDYLYSGSNSVADVAWYDGNTRIGNTNGSRKTTRTVGTRMANELGLHDMSGNVWEWVEDDLHNSFAGAPTDGSAWVDVPRGAFRVSRGGGWAYPERICRTAGRDAYAPANRGPHFGFRLVLQL
ncbi:MAG: formylglycine-generating enzyme family protein [Saprospiraceae bacterium]|jgi:sulfatase modifying factor 1|nr:formylglycine-generating enzyme family protein [Saprospiraceae bacterium]